MSNFLSIFRRFLWLEKTSITSLICFFPFWVGEVTAVLMSLGVIPHDDYLVTDVMMSSFIGYAPVVVGFVSLLYGMRRGFSLVLPVLVMLSFVPTIAYTYLLTTSSGVEIFLWIYGLVSLFAVSLGWLWKKYAQ